MWFKHDSNFLKQLWPNHPPALRSQLCWLAMLAWEEQGIIKDFAYLTWLTGLTVDTLEAIWPEFVGVSICRDNRWMPAKMWDGVDAYEAKSQQARNAAQASVVRRLSSGSAAAQRTLSSGSADLDKNKNKNKNKSKSKNPADALASGADALAGTGESSANPEPARGKPPDPHHEIFCVGFRAHYGIDCRVLVKDWTQLAALRRTMAEGLSVSDWQTAVDNYFNTPQANHTLADLANRYPTFHKYPLDRYGKPVEAAPATGIIPQASILEPPPGFWPYPIARDRLHPTMDEKLEQQRWQRQFVGYYNQLPEAERKALVGLNGNGCGATQTRTSDAERERGAHIVA